MGYRELLLTFCTVTGAEAKDRETVRGGSPRRQGS
jgi:hypothetical protein